VNFTDKADFKIVLDGVVLAIVEATCSVQFVYRGVRHNFYRSLGAEWLVV
jgi:hypothetical protein